MHSRILVVLALLTGFLAAQGTITTISPTSALAGAAGFTLTVNGSGFASGNVVQWSGTSLATTFVSSTQLTATVTTALLATGGANSIRVKLNHVQNVFSNSVTFNVNNPLPTVSALSPSSTVIGSMAFTLTVTGSNFVPGAAIEWNSNAMTTTFNSSTSLTATVPNGLVSAIGTSTVKVRNPAPGGGLSLGLPFSTTLNVVPTLTSISPTSVTAGGPAFTLTLNGTNFNTTTIVNVGGQSQPVTSVSPTQLTVTVSASLLVVGNTLNVGVNNITMGGGVAGPLPLTVNNPLPTISSVSPGILTAGVAGVVAVTGTGFVTNTQVLVDGVSYPTSYVNATQVNLSITPLIATGGATLSIRTFNSTPGGGTSILDRPISVVNPAPSLTSINPTTAPANDGSNVILAIGSSFTPSSFVRFDGIALTTSFLSTTQLQSTAPAGMLAAGGTHTITVTTPAPGGGTSSGATLTVNNPSPTASSLVPSSLTVSGSAAQISVLGSQFVSTSTVRLDGVAIATTFVSHSQLDATVPGSALHAAGTHSITVFTPAPAGGTTAPVTLTVNNPAPVLSSINPTSVNVGAGSIVVTAFGTGFVSTSTFLLDGNPLPTTFGSNQVFATILASVTNTAGSHTISVSSPSPGGGTSATIPFNVLNPLPTLSLITPSSAPVNGTPPTMIVNGTNFVSSSQVLFDGNVLSTTFLNAGAVSATVPASAMNPAGAHNVAVVSPGPGGGQTISATFTVQNPFPVITGLVPATVAVGAGTTPLTINGTGFMPETTVEIVGVGLQVINIATPTTLQITLPNGSFVSPGQILVRIDNPGPGGGTAPDAVVTIFNAVPTIATAGAASPPFVSTSAETLVLTGTGFHTLSVIKIDGNPFPTTFSGTIGGANQLTAPVGPNFLSAGTHQVEVSNSGNGGGDSAPFAFVVQNPAANIVSTSPSLIAGGGGDVFVTATGTQFVSTTVISAEGLPLVTIPASSTQVQFILPGWMTRTTRLLNVAATNPAPGGGSSTTAIMINGPAISGVSPSVIPVMAAGSTPVTLTVQGQLQVGNDTIRINGAIVPTQVVNGSTLTCSLDPAQFPVLTQPGGFAVTLTRIGALEHVASNAVAVTVGVPGSPDNAGTVTFAGAPPAPLQPCNIRVQTALPNVPVTLLAELAPPSLVTLNLAPGFDLVVGPGLNAPFVLTDGIGLFGPSTGATMGSYDLSPWGLPVSGILEIPLDVPPVSLGITFSLAAVYGDPGSPIGVNATHVTGPHFF